jgi:hypothetical protein
MTESRIAPANTFNASRVRDVDVGQILALVPREGVICSQIVTGANRSSAAGSDFETALGDRVLS